MKLLYQLILAGATMHGLCHAATTEVKTNAEKKNSAAKNMQQWELKFFDGMFFISDKSISTKAIERENRTACIATAFDKLPKEKLLQMPQCIEPMIAQKYLQQQRMLALEFIRKNKMQLIPAVVPSSANVTKTNATNIVYELLTARREHNEYCAQYGHWNTNPLEACFATLCRLNMSKTNYITSSGGGKYDSDYIQQSKKAYDVLFGSLGYIDGTMKWYVPEQFIKQLMQLSVNQLQFIARLFYMHQQGTLKSDGILLEKTGTIIFSDKIRERSSGYSRLSYPVIRFSQEDMKVFRSLPEAIQNNLFINYHLHK